MIKINLNYNPYTMEIVLEVNGKDVFTNNNYKFNEYKNIPLQTWVDPVPQNNWKGLFGEVAGKNENKIELFFHGREIDFLSVISAFKAFDVERNGTMELNVAEKDFYLSDEKIISNIKRAYNEMQKPEFTRLMEEIDEKSGGGITTKEAFDGFKKVYSSMEQQEMEIVLIGTYSSGKSTLLNALMKKDILFMDSDTATQKACTIFHKPEKTMYIECFRNKKNLIKKDKSDDCKKIKELLRQYNADKDVDNIHLYVDLSHLLPVGCENFKLRLTDTPGTNSAQGNAATHDEEKHINIAKEAVMGKNKLVLFIFDQNNCQVEGINNLINEIQTEIKINKNEFFGRFLFVLNKCDDLDKTVKEKIKVFYEGLKEAGFKICPKVVTVAALPALAYHLGLHKLETSTIFSTEEEKKQVYSYFSKFRNFKEKSEFYSKEETYLDQYGSFSQFIKENIINLTESTEEDDEKVLFHTAMPSLELNIQQYIQQYRYPMVIGNVLQELQKVVQLLEKRTDYFTRLMKDIQQKHTEEIKKIEDKGAVVKQKIDNEKKKKQEEEKKQKELQNILTQLEEKTKTIKGTDIERYKNTMMGVKNEKLIILKKDIGFAKLTKEKFKSEEEIRGKLNEINKNMHTIAKEIVEGLNDVKNNAIMDIRQHEQNIQYIVHLAKSVELNGYEFGADIQINMDVINLEVAGKEMLKEQKEMVDNPEREVRLTWNPFSLFGIIPSVLRGIFEPEKVEKKYFELNMNELDKIFEEYNMSLNKTTEDCYRGIEKYIKSSMHQLNEKIEKLTSSIKNTEYSIRKMEREIKEEYYRAENNNKEKQKSEEALSRDIKAMEKKGAYILQVKNMLTQEII